MAAPTRKPPAGYNHDIPYEGTIYHVQTEYMTRPTPHIGTQIYSGGRVLEAAKAPVEPATLGDDDRIAAAVKAQHKAMIRRLLSGRVATGAVLGAAPTIEPPRPGDATAEARAPEGAASEDRLLTDLELRRSSVLVLRATGPDRPPSDDELRDRVRSILTGLATIAGRPSHARSRRGELAELFMLRSEALAWLCDRDRIEDGRRLWRRFARIAETLEGINHRKTLVDHDLQIWERARAHLATLEPSAPVGADQIEELRSTWGRDLDLDRLLDSPQDLRVGGLVEALNVADGALRRALETRVERDVRSADRSRSDAGS